MRLPILRIATSTVSTTSWKSSRKFIDACPLMQCRAYQKCIGRYGSFHGGVWRAAYKVDSLGLPSVLIHFLGGPMLALLVSYGFVIGCAVFFSSGAFLNSGECLVYGKAYYTWPIDFIALECTFNDRLR